MQNNDILNDNITKTEPESKNEAKYIKLGLTLFLSISACILFYYLLFYGTDLKQNIIKFFSIFTSITLGIGVAYILNPLMKFFENEVIGKLFDFIAKKRNKQIKKEFKIKRALSVLLTMVSFGLILYSLIIMIVPQVISSIQNIILRVPIYFNNLNEWGNKFLEENPELQKIANDYWIDIEQWFTTSFVPKIQEWISKFSSSLVGSVVNIFSGLISFIIGFIVSIYLLYSKEMFCAQAKKVAYAFMSTERANTFINNMRYGNKIFGGFISGKLLDSLIIGILCYICMLVLKMPYAALISVIVGVTNIIPYFGPFIGAIPSAILILMVNPMKCLTFIIFILILQQFDGNVIGPKILGESTGLNSFWVIFSITLFSGLFGVMGMFIGVPVFAVFYAGVRTLVETRLEKKQLPVSTDYYRKNDYYDSETADRNSGKEIRFVKKTFDNVYPEKNNMEKNIHEVNKPFKDNSETGSEEINEGNSTNKMEE